ncbi:hypothetical protein GWN26_07145, partial [Candidatus Saccharibacteria bacterium]|nr:hypothetical protein [Candidatus Saccharibacteria bacterium]NIW80472.1 hypothetical protein [Calditrichia bacterium]
MSFYFDGHWSASHLFRNLSDSEQVRLEALRSIARQDAEVAVPALEKIIREDPSPALRYKAVHYLGRYLDEEGVLSLLEDVIKNDSNIDVRKKAIYVLSKSKDPRAVDILE